jgi:hypothetical protein
MRNDMPAIVHFSVFAICADQPPGYYIQSQIFTIRTDNTVATEPCGAGGVSLGGGLAVTKHVPGVFMTASSPNGSAGWTATVSNTTGHKEGKGILYTICGH